MSEHELEISDETLDRLVDGELSEVEYRQVLQELDVQPERWRRCGLAFLEAQAWGREFRAVRHEPASAAIAAQTSPRWSWQDYGILMLASAASFLLAFGVANRYGNRAAPSSLNQMVRAAKPELPSQPSAEAPEVLVDLPADSREDAEPWGRYRYVVNGGVGEPREFQMPVFAVDDPRAEMLLDEQSSMPMELIRALEARGNDVQPRRRWVPIEQASGGPIFVPVDELTITPVSNRSFH